MMFRTFSFLAMCLPALLVAVSSQETEDEMMEIPEGKLFLSEEFLSFEEMVARVNEHGNSNLRRGLQSSPACRAQAPLNKLRPEGQFCSALSRYPCSCSGISETACNYCALRPEPNQITCQVSGSLITFLDHTNTVTTCGCEYLGNGQRSQFCYQASGPVPIPPPAVVIEPLPPVGPRAPFGPSFPAAPAPVAPAPTTMGGSKGSGKGGGKGDGKGGGKGSRRV